MKYFWIILAALGTAVLLALCYVLIVALTPLASAYAGLIGAVLGAVLLAAALGGLRILFAAGRHRAALARAAEIMPMQNGHLIHVDDVTLLAAPLLGRTLDRHYDVERVRAAVSPSLTHYHNEIHPAMPLLPPDALLGISGPPMSPQLLSPVLDLASALDRGLSTPDAWLIGHDANGQPQQAQLDHTGMIAISGVPGTGKTWSAAWLAAQTAAHGGALFVADPHHGDKDSLSTRIAGFAGAVDRVAVTPDEINAMILHIAKIYDWRSAHPGVATSPILLLIDEFMQLMLRKQLSDEAERALVVLSGGGRKKDMFGGLISQNWSANALGQRVTVLRQIVTGSLVHQSDEETARFLLPRSYATQAATLQPGEALWFGTGAPVQLRVPLLSSADVALVARRHPPRSNRLASDRRQVASASAGQIAPTEPIAPAAAAPTVQLPTPTNQEQIKDVLAARPWLTSTEIATATGIDVRVVRTSLTPLERTREIVRRPTQRPGADKFEYALSQSINQPTGTAITA